MERKIDEGSTSVVDVDDDDEGFSEKSESENSA